MKGIYAIILGLLLCGCTSRTYTIDPMAQDSKMTYHLHSESWGYCGIGICGDFVWHYSYTTNFNLIVPSGKSEFDLRETELYFQDKRLFIEPHYHGKITLGQSELTIKVIGYNDEEAEESGQYKLAPTK